MSGTHNEIRDSLLSAARAAGLDAEAEVRLDGWPTRDLGRIDVLIHHPHTGIEVKTEAGDKPAYPEKWAEQIARYRRLIGTASGLWIVSTTVPDWALSQHFLMDTGCRVDTVERFMARLARYGRNGTPFAYYLHPRDLMERAA